MTRHSAPQLEASLNRPPQSSPPTPGWVVVLASAAFAVSFLAFVHITARVRLANVDDALFQNMVSAHAQRATLAQFAVDQGRFFYTLPNWEFVLQFYAIRDPLLFSFLRATLFYGGAVLIGGLLTRITGNRPLGALIGLVIVTTLHLPAVYFPILSYPTIAIAWCAVLASFHCTLSASRSGRMIPAWSAAGLFLFACLFTESLVIFAPLHLAVAAAPTRPSVRSLTKATAPLGLVLAGFLAVYAIYAHQHRSKYSGTQLNFDPPEIANVLVRQTLAVTPGFELAVQRHQVQNEGERWKTAVQVRQLLARVPRWSLALAVLQWSAIMAVAAHSRRGPSPTMLVLFISLAYILLPNLLPSVTQGHQIMAHQRQYPYVYSYFAFCAAIVTTLGIWQRLADSQAGALRQKAALASLAVVVALVLWSAQASNHDTLRLLHQWYN